ncbi:hypothetical protein [Nakamurella deserti]|uniref:hypothetical protein n=1 Tax=Nakamurella deserti TaxID=2164074 RepID=UPI000DBE1125|nr:hypothetical protein [Nakamurella deserti]
MHSPDTALDGRERILHSTVTLLIERGLGAIDADAICAAAGLGRAEFDRWFDSLESIYVAITARLLDSHVANPGGPVRLAACLETGLRTSLRAVWDMIEQRIDEHHALHVLLLGQVGDPGLLARMGFSLHTTHLRIAEQWLAGVEARYGIEWVVPVPQLAALVQATLDGLMIDYVARRDGVQAREVLDIFAGHLATNALLV